MKNSKELRELLDAKKAEARELVKGFEGEQLTDEQRDSIDSLTNEIEVLKSDLERTIKMEEVTKEEARKAASVAGHKASTGEERELDKMAADFTFGEAVRAAYGVSKDKGFMDEVRQMGEEEARKIGKSTSGIAIPSKIHSRLSSPEKRANVTENTTTGIQTTDFVQSVYAKTILSQLGGTFISAVEDTRVPIIGTVSTQWEGETDAAADGGSATTKVDMTPIRLSGYVNYSKQAALQANYSLEGALRDAFASAIAAKFEYACFTDDSSNGAFNYLGNGKTAVTGATGVALVHELVEEVLGNNHLQGNLGFAISHSLYSEIQTAVLATGVSALVQNDMIEGMYPFEYSTQIADIASGQESIYFGDWSKVWSAQFGPIDLMVDPYSVATSGMDRLVLNSFWDMALIQDAAISVGGYTG